MKRIKSKYPFKIGETLINKGEEGRTATLEEMQKIFPNISYKKESNFCGVVFRGFSPCLVLLKQIEFLE